MTSEKQLVITNIEWDAPRSADLPKQVVININEDNIDLLEDVDGYASNVCDYLSDEYGWCIKGFAVDVCIALEDAISIAAAEGQKQESAPCRMAREEMDR